MRVGGGGGGIPSGLEIRLYHTYEHLPGVRLLPTTPTIAAGLELQDFSVYLQSNNLSYTTLKQAERIAEIRILSSNLGTECSDSLTDFLSKHLHKTGMNCLGHQCSTLNFMSSKTEINLWVKIL